MFLSENEFWAVFIETIFKKFLECTKFLRFDNKIGLLNSQKPIKFLEKLIPQKYFPDIAEAYLQSSRTSTMKLFLQK